MVPMKVGGMGRETAPFFNANRNKSDTELRKKYNRLRNKIIKQTRKAKSKHFCEKIEENKIIRNYFGGNLIQ